MRRSVEIAVAPPFRLDLTIWALRRQPHNAVDAWDGSSWRRSVAEVPGPGGPMALRVRDLGTPDAPRLEVLLERDGRLPAAAVAACRALVERALGLGADLTGFYALTEADPRLSGLARRFAGVRPPRFPSVFEALANAIACQQLSLAVGIHVLNRLAHALSAAPGGASAEDASAPGGARPAPPPAFPAPEQVAAADPTMLRQLGYSDAKARALVGLSRAVAGGEIDLEGLAGLDDDEARARLVALPGIGRWSAEYALLRGLGRWHVLPGDDVGARNSLRRRFGLSGEGGYDAVAALSREWWPYGGLVYFHLLLDRLDAAGRLGDGQRPPPG